MSQWLESQCIRICGNWNKGPTKFQWKDGLWSCKGMILSSRPRTKIHCMHALKYWCCYNWCCAIKFAGYFFWIALITANNLLSLFNYFPNIWLGNAVLVNLAICNHWWMTYSLVSCQTTFWLAYLLTYLIFELSFLHLQVNETVLLLDYAYGWSVSVQPPPTKIILSILSGKLPLVL